MEPIYFDFKRFSADARAFHTNLAEKGWSNMAAVAHPSQHICDYFLDQYGDGIIRRLNEIDADEAAKFEVANRDEPETDVVEGGVVVTINEVDI